jgi:hypothetical protein
MIKDRVRAAFASILLAVASQQVMMSGMSESSDRFHLES